MKRLTLIFVCALLVVALVVPSVVLAESKVANDVHFIAPVGIALVGNNLLIADNVADEQSAILCFDVTTNSNVHKFTFLLEEQAKNISTSGERIFVVFESKFVEYKISTDGKGLEQVKVFEQPNVIDVAVGKLGVDASSMAETIYFLQSGKNADSLKYIKNDGTAGTINGMDVPTAYSLLAISSGEEHFVYVAGANADGSNSVTRWGSMHGWSISDDTLNANGISYAQGFELKGITTNNRNYPIVYGEKSMYNLNENGNNGYIAEQVFADFSANEHKNVKVIASTDKLVLLNSNNQVNIYTLNGTELDASSYSTIGSDKVGTQIPTEYTAFTLAKSTGYPTNIIYKTTDEQTSIQSIMTKDQVAEFLILHYDGCENSNYYYVLVGNKFGWIKKSDGATSPDTDGKIAIIDTKVSDKVTFNANIKFSSLGKVYVYDLPNSNPTTAKLIDTVTQTADTQTPVKILQQFKEGNIVWYYIEYNQKFGFVKSSEIGNITATANEDIVIVDNFKVNSTLFGAVNLYMTSDLENGEKVTIDGKKEAKLYSGDWVKVLEQKGNASLVQIVEKDGTVSYGWVDSSRLISINSMTTNSIVGLVALGLAIILTVVFIVIFVKRKKKDTKK